MRKVTLKDIAEKCSVSQATVSLVLNDAPSRISEEKRIEIKKVAKELNYRPNLVARGLSTSKTNTIGLIIPDIENPYFSTLSKYIEDMMREEGYLVFICNSNDLVENDKKLLEKLLDYRVDGILICPSDESYSLSDKELKDLFTVSTPLVLVDRVYSNLEFNQVSFDNILGGYLATSYLIKEGYSKIACITGNLSTRNGRDRYEGYLKALDEFNLDVDKDFIREGDYRYRTGEKLGLDILKKNEIDAVFTANDLMAYGFMSAMRKLKVGEDTIKVVGYDNLKQSDMFGQELVSVDQDIFELAYYACRQLLQEIEDNSFSKNTKLSPKLMSGKNLTTIS